MQHAAELYLLITDEHQHTGQTTKILTHQNKLTFVDTTSTYHVNIQMTKNWSPNNLQGDCILNI
jgi:hypothetical protein